MSYTVPTVSYLKAHYPAFTGVADVVVQSALDEAALRVDESWLESDFTIARMLYAMHVITFRGQNPSSNESKAAVFAISGLDLVKSGSLQVGQRRAVPGSKSGGSTLERTSYGLAFLELMKMNHPAVLVVGGDGGC